MITLYEAALINYFSPGLNIEYKSEFPNQALKSYCEIFSTDFNRMTFELNIAELRVRVFSKSVPLRKYYHCRTFSLPDGQERTTFLYDEEQ